MVKDRPLENQLGEDDLDGYQVHELLEGFGLKPNEEKALYLYLRMKNRGCDWLAHG